MPPSGPRRVGLGIDALLPPSRRPAPPPRRGPDAPPRTPADPAPSSGLRPVVRAEPMVVDRARIFDLAGLYGRQSIHLDAAHAAFYGDASWAAHLAASGSGVLCCHPRGVDQGELVFDLAPALVDRRFDVACRRLLGVGGRARFCGPARIVDDVAEPWPEGLGAALASARLALRDRLVGDPADLRLDDRPGWATEEASLLARGGDDLATLLDAALRLGPLEDGFDGRVRIGSGGEGPSEPFPPQGRHADVPEHAEERRHADEVAAELVSSTLGAALHLREAARYFDRLVRAFPYHGVVEGHGARMRTFAGLHLVSLYALLRQRFCGDVFRTRMPIRDAGSPGRRPDAAGPFAPSLFGSDVSGVARPLSAEAFEDAFARLKPFCADPLAGGNRFTAADLAEGYEASVWFAYARVALEADALGLSPAPGPSDPELAFWRAGIERPPGDCRSGASRPASSWGLMPLAGRGGFDPRTLALEPQGVVDAIRARRRDAGLDDDATRVAIEMRRRASGFVAVPTWFPLAVERATETRFERKVADVRRDIAAREARGLLGDGVTRAYATQFTGGTNYVGGVGTITGGIYVAGGSFQPSLPGSVVGTALAVTGPIAFASGS